MRALATWLYSVSALDWTSEGGLKRIYEQFSWCCAHQLLFTSLNIAEMYAEMSDGLRGLGGLRIYIGLSILGLVGKRTAWGGTCPGVCIVGGCAIRRLWADFLRWGAGSAACFIKRVTSGVDAGLGEGVSGSESHFVLVMTVPPLPLCNWPPERATVSRGGGETVPK